MSEGGVVAYDPLVNESDLSGMPGAPFSPSMVAAACEAIRNAAGWHIAPAVTETLRVDSDGATYLRLPTGRLTAVTAVRDVTGDAPVALTDYRVSYRLGGLFRRGGWPCGFEAVEVDVTHGYDECPADLMRVIAEGAQRRMRQQASGPFSVTFADELGLGAPSLVDAVAPYKLGPRP